MHARAQVQPKTERFLGGLRTWARGVRRSDGESSTHDTRGGSVPRMYARMRGLWQRARARACTPAPNGLSRADGACSRAPRMYRANRAAEWPAASALGGRRAAAADSLGTACTYVAAEPRRREVAKEKRSYEIKGRSGRGLARCPVPRGWGAAEASCRPFGRFGTYICDCNYTRKRNAINACMLLFIAQYELKNTQMQRHKQATERRQYYVFL